MFGNRSVAEDIRSDGGGYAFRRSNAAPQPSTWGEPFALFYTTPGSASDCPATHFKDQQLIFDITLCGYWAGGAFKDDCPAAYAKTGGTGSTQAACAAFVGGNPNAFTDAIWQINSLKVYSSAGAPRPPPGPPPGPPPPPGPCRFTPNTDYTGLTVGGGNAATPTSCCTLCIKYGTRCTAAVWAGTVCTLFGKGATPKPNQAGRTACVPK